MHDTYDFAAQMSQPLVLWTMGGLVFGIVVAIIIIEAVRRRRLGGHIPKRARSAQSNFFRRSLNSYREIRQAVKDRHAEKTWLRNYEESQERNAEARRRDLDE